MTALHPAFLAALAILLIPRAEATNYTWAGGTAAWDTAASWTPNIAGGPVTGDSIINAATGATRMNINSTITPSVSLVNMDFSLMGGAAAIYNNASTGNNNPLSFTSTGTLTKATVYNLTIRGHTGGNMSVSLNNIEQTDGQLYFGADYATDPKYGLTAFNVSGTANLSSTSAGSAFAIGTAAGVTASFQQVNLGGNITFRLSNTSGANRVRNVTMTGLNGTSGTAVHGNNVNNTGTSYTTLTINSTPSTTSTFNGTISNGTGTGHFLNLVKGDTGTQVLGGNNTYTGNTIVSGGTLLVNNTTGSGTGTGAVTVASGATLGGNGRITGATTITGILSPGNGGIGTLNIANNVTWKGASSNGTSTDWIFQLGSGNTSDALNIAGDFTRDTSVGTNFRFDFGGNTNTGTFKLVDWTVSSSFSSGDFSYTNLGSGLTGSFAINGSQLDFTVYSAVPEPATWIAMFALGLGGTILAICRCRRRGSTTGLGASPQL